ncbi:hypothetical protein [Rhodovulum imhoffii]|uniref:hypothetical protein n=1 Tax=Rhodovulum imhoffii TaxID=365340 RepID=UPI000D386748|nr:hypothetical protein [Rhodovulum imhoffii]
MTRFARLRAPSPDLAHRCGNRPHRAGLSGADPWRLQPDPRNDGERAAASAFDNVFTQALISRDTLLLLLSFAGLAVGTVLAARVLNGRGFPA